MLNEGCLGGDAVVLNIGSGVVVAAVLLLSSNTVESDVGAVDVKSDCGVLTELKPDPSEINPSLKILFCAFDVFGNNTEMPKA